MKNKFVRLFIDTVLGMIFCFMLPLASIFIVPNIAFRISGGNMEITMWTFFVHALLLLAVITTLIRMDHER